MRLITNMRMKSMSYNRIIFSSLILAAICVLAINPAFAKDEIPFDLPAESELSKLSTAVIFTNKGNITIELYPQEAPWHVANLKYLADKGFYKNLKFHLYIDSYVIQGGDPRGDGLGGPGYTLPPEFGQRKHSKGTVGMSRTRDSLNPERRSNGSQFHILLSDAPRMDNEYTIFGKIISGLAVAKKLRKGDVIEDLVVYVRK